MQTSLLLFIVLLCTLTISVYFGNMSLNLTEQMTTTPPNAGSVAANNIGQSEITTPVPTIKHKKNKKHDDDYEDDEEEEEDESNTKCNKRRNKRDQLTGIELPTADRLPPTFLPGQQPPALLFPNQNQPQNANPVSDYYNWLAFWNTVANSNDPSAMFQSSNYISKTAVVPPVCPNCPQCSAGAGGSASTGTGVCTSCGGQGGSGTTSVYRNKFSDFLAIYGSGYKGDGKWRGFYGEDRSRGPGLGRLAEEAGSGAVDLTKTALNDATGLARDTGSGAVGLLKDTGSGAVGLLKETGSGVKDLLEDAGSGVAGLLKSNPTQLGETPAPTNNNQGQQGGSSGNNPYQSGYYSQGTYNLPSNPLGIQGIDPYSYNGALVSKGSNYIPITDDFSAFRK